MHLKWPSKAKTIFRYTLEDAKFWITHCINAQNALLPIPTIQQRRTLFFSYEDSVPIQIPLQAIRHNGKFIGCCSLSQESKEEGGCELGYYIHPDYQGKRIMYAACKEVLKYAANEFGIRKVLCSADVCNAASRRNIERLVKDYKDVVVTQKTIPWPPHKKVEGRNLYSVGTTWTWNIEPDEGH